MGVLLEQVKTGGALGVLALCLFALATYYVQSVAKWSKERAALLDAARVERDKLLAEAKLDRERHDRELAAERAQTAASYEKRIQDHKENAQRLYDQNQGWMELANETNATLALLGERVGSLGRH